MLYTGLLAALMLTLACEVSDFPRALSVGTPTQTKTISPSPTKKPTFTPLPPTFTPKPIPPWVMQFSDPILKAVSDRQPDLHDEFSRLNRGWLRVVPEDQTRRYYALIQDGALLMQLPEGKENRDLTLYNPKLDREDFVLSFDFKFGKTEPNDILRVQFNQTPDRDAALDLSKNETWVFHWRLQNNRESSAGTYFYFSPERINVVLIMRGEECAVYLNHDPLEYFPDCRYGSIVQPFPPIVTIHLLGTPGDAAAVMIDNVKFWDLDKNPDSP